VPNDSKSVAATDTLQSLKDAISGQASGQAKAGESVVASKPQPEAEVAAASLPVAKPQPVQPARTSAPNVANAVSTIPSVTPAATSAGACPYTFKVYVYNIDPLLGSVYLAEEARKNRTLHVCKKCIFEQFALEYIVHDFFTQFCGRTMDPKEADYFYLPLIRDAEFRMQLEMRGPRSRDPSPSEKALLSVLEKRDFTLWREVGCSMGVHIHSSILTFIYTNIHT
jgi:hypothetical protein